MAPLAPTTRLNIIARLSTGESTRVVGAELGVSKSVVSNVRRRMSSPPPPPTAGPKPRLTARDKRKLTQLVARGEAKTAVEAARLIGPELARPVGAQTVRNALRAAGLKAKKRVAKPGLSATHRARRLR